MSTEKEFSWEEFTDQEPPACKECGRVGPGCECSHYYAEEE